MANQTNTNKVNEKTTLPATPDGWQLCRLKHESPDIVVELNYLQNQLSLLIENTKTCIEHPCKNLTEAQAHVAKLFGKRRAEKIFSQWHEIGYRRQ